MYPVSTLGDVNCFEDSICPFPWANAPPDVAAAPTNIALSEKVPTPTLDSGKCKPKGLCASDVIPKRVNPELQRFADYANCYPHLQNLQSKLEEHFPGKVRFDLPRLGALSGSVVRHCANLLDDLIDSQSPVMFKIGFTHNPFWRWGNSIYGYCSAVEKWSFMVVIYAAPEPHSPAMLEAALIDKYKGTGFKSILVSFIKAFHPQYVLVTVQPKIDKLVKSTSLATVHFPFWPRHPWMQERKTWW